MFLGRASDPRPGRVPQSRRLPSLSIAWRAQSALYLNLAPPSAASYIRPPLMIEKEAMPFSYPPTALVVASFFPALAPPDVPLVLAPADAPAVMATALALAPNSKLPDVNSLNDRSSWKKTSRL